MLFSFSEGQFANMRASAVKIVRMTQVEDDELFAIFCEHVALINDFTNVGTSSP